MTPARFVAISKATNLGLGLAESQTFPPQAQQQQQTCSEYSFPSTPLPFCVLPLLVSASVKLHLLFFVVARGQPKVGCLATFKKDPKWVTAQGRQRQQWPRKYSSN